MKRRDFLGKTAGGAFAAGLLPSAANASGPSRPLSDRSSDRWYKVASEEMGTPIRKKTVDCDVAVMGGGLAGICAAVAAARNGAKVVLVQDRPVLGGNASSEIRVHVNGVTHLRPRGIPERETGIIEEILLHNRFRNPQESYPVWDHVLYDFVVREPNLELMLNTQAIQANTAGSTITSARCWQLTTETEITLRGKLFIDCSGDGLLAASAGALYRTGREASSEFGEKYAPKVADGWQMGASILLSAKDMGKPMPYEPPSYVIKYEAEMAHPKRKIKPYEGGIWWVELGSEFDIIAEQETNRHKLMGFLHGVWDYIKNSGEFPEAENQALDWVGSLPGRRESRRFIGDYILSETDLTEHQHFDDAVAYGGWSLDEHNPGGIENLSEPPSYFHEHFSEVYEIPFRSLYSKNVSNLLFAGRNISQTHIALSSSRVMGTCALMGQAVGTAAMLCLRNNVGPRKLAESHINELQEQLLREDAFIPNRPANDANDLAKTASVLFASSTLSGDPATLTDGVARDFKDQIHHWESDGLPAEVQLEWDRPVSLSTIEIKCDTNVKKNILMRKDSRVDETFTNTIPKELLKSLEVEVRVQGDWIHVGSLEKNRTRRIRFLFETLSATAVRIRAKETYGAENVRLYEVRCYQARV
ncbi:FAD-dependent oxidoreductase [Novipirellula artificiosorum]|uniref:Tricarballylate dehydrogenase n=1 Tax=Novipirellula artificiosorum TaxID=2528016 RepID=A0A5C6E319_9BACT|nr:FAD-dependent oxidoreductase [Novipirellula artificiosorum]TWU42357.1 tricarballylate dehydrogenase [Novipirellula artificiosorum]